MSAVFEAGPEEGRRVGRYELRAPLGRGAMGAVYRAYDPHIDREVAVKVLRPWMATREQQQELHLRFLAEVRAAGRLRHPGVVSVFDAGRDQETGAAFLAMELVEGCSLEQLLESHPVLPVEVAAEVTAQVAEALGVAHDQGIVHRDLKPENLLITVDGCVKLSDFGIVKIGQEAITQTGQVLGTPLYMAPEQLLGQEVGAPSDLYALGSVLYRCLTGSPPFQGESIGRLAYRIAHQEPRSPAEVNQQLSETMVEIVMRSLEKEPAKRFPSAGDFARELREQTPGEGARAALRVLVSEVAEDRSIAELSEPIPPGELATLPLSQAQTRREAGRGSKLRRGLLGSLLVVAVLAGVGWLIDESTGGFVWPGEVVPDRELPRTTLEEPAPEPIGIQEPAPAPFQLRLEYRNRIAEGELRVRCDGEVIWREPLQMKGLHRRLVGTPMIVNLGIPPGRRELEIAIEGRSMQVDARASLSHDFPSGASGILRASLNPYTERLRLGWR